MGFLQNVQLCRRVSCLAIAFIFLFIFSSTQVTLKVEGRLVATPTAAAGFSQLEEEKVRAQIGSRPPRCERSCSSCPRCEAIQVPTNPAVTHGDAKHSTISSIVTYARGDDDSNYKPMKWKCKCGSLILDP